MKTNYDKILEETINELKGRKPSILLHSCCAPCSTAVISRLKDYFDITIFYYNPNIEPLEEYLKRKEEQKRIVSEFGIKFLDCDYENEKFKSMSKGLEDLPEGGYRCHKCYELRLTKTALTAKENNFLYFGTTLTVSPYKLSNIILVSSILILLKLTILPIVSNSSIYLLAEKIRELNMQVPQFSSFIMSS